MTFAETMESRIHELKVMKVNERLDLWVKLHKRSEFANKFFGGAGIVCGAVSSQLSDNPKVLLFTGLSAAISTAFLTFLNLKARSITFVNAWRIVDKARNKYLSEESAKIEIVGEALNKAEEYIQNSIHKL